MCKLQFSTFLLTPIVLTLHVSIALPHLQSYSPGGYAPRSVAILTLTFTIIVGVLGGGFLGTMAAHALRYVLHRGPDSEF